MNGEPGEQPPLPNLETYRFHPTAESLTLMKNIRASVVDIQREHPELAGIGFAGSRTKGVEGPNSDIDLHIFYDSDVARQAGNPDLNVDLVASLIPTGNVEKHTSGGPGFATDISKGRLDRMFQTFLEDVNHLASVRQVPINDVTFGEHDVFLRPLFMLAVGDKVYRARQYVLDKFKTIPNGEVYFNVLMNKLEADESEGKHNYPHYLHYPKSISDAENFFITKPASFGEVDIPLHDAEVFENQPSIGERVGGILKKLIKK